MRAHLPHHVKMSEQDRQRVLNESGVVVHRRDQNKPVAYYRPVIRLVRPMSLDELLDDDDAGDDSRG